MTHQTPTSPLAELEKQFYTDPNTQGIITSIQGMADIVMASDHAGYGAKADRAAKDLGEIIDVLADQAGLGQLEKELLVGDFFGIPRPIEAHDDTTVDNEDDAKVPKVFGIPAVKLTADTYAGEPTKVIDTEAHDESPKPPFFDWKNDDHDLAAPITRKPIVVQGGPVARPKTPVAKPAIVVISAPPVEVPESPKNPEKQQKLSMESAVAEKWHRGEDSYLNVPELGLFGVFDGAGGESGNPKAVSQAAADSIAHFFGVLSPDTTLGIRGLMEHALAKASHDIEISDVHGKTTAIVGKVFEVDFKQYLGWANAGDSVLFQVRDGQVTQISTEQCLPAPQSNVITNCLPNEPTSDPRATQNESGVIEIQEGDRFIFVSDGITGDKKEHRLTDEDKRVAFTRGAQPSAQNAADAAIGVSKKRDDKTVVVVDFDSV